MTGSNCFASSKHLSNFQNQTRSSHAQENLLVSRSHRKQPKKKRKETTLHGTGSYAGKRHCLVNHFSIRLVEKMARVLRTN